MNKIIFLFILFITISEEAGLCGEQDNPQRVQKDPSKEYQILYNGKEWRNLYSMVKGDQFLFSKEYLPGSLSINGKTYIDLLLNYDIYNDEILIPGTRGSIIQLNKEMVDSFTLVFDNKTYKFINTQADSMEVIKGFVKELYQGKSALYVKYKKEIAFLAVEDKYDLFFRTYRIYILKGGNVIQLSGKKDLLKVLNENKIQIKDFMKKNKLKVTKKDPNSFIPVIRYYDSLSQ